MTAPLLVLPSTKSADALGKAVEDAVARHGFTVLGVHDLGAKLREKGQPYTAQCRVYEVCNAVQAARALTARPEVSTALPCRISVFTKDDGMAYAATILPSALLAMFDAPALVDVGAAVEATLTAILHDAVA